jgi:hypothetical protein
VNLIAKRLDREGKVSRERQPGKLVEVVAYSGQGDYSRPRRGSARARRAPAENTPNIGGKWKAAIPGLLGQSLALGRGKAPGDDSCETASGEDRGKRRRLSNRGKGSKSALPEQRREVGRGGDSISLKSLIFIRGEAKVHDSAAVHRFSFLLSSRRRERRDVVRMSTSH